MARRPNYGFQKRQKELKRQQKKDAKAERKRLKKEGAEDTGEATVSEDAESVEQADGDVASAGG
ncbi:MAG: hypothetical protein ACRELX_02400 [Longimicrobiales bacterium]